MKKTLIILFLFICGINIAQDNYPSIVIFEVNNKTTKDDGEVVWIKDAYHFLMLNLQKAIDLKNYGNLECEFNIIGRNANRILLEFQQPSKLIRKGMCAAGSEKSFLYLELDHNIDVNKSEIYLTESCLWSIETISKLNKNSEIVAYVCENLQTSESYTISIDTSNVKIVKEENK